MNTHKVGMTLGMLFGLWHLVWSILIALGLAKPLLDFVSMMHSLNNPYIVQPFNLGKSIGLIILTYVIGYFVGTVFATIWNKTHKVR